MSRGAADPPVPPRRQVPVRWCWASEDALLARLEEEDLATAAAAARALRDRVQEIAGEGDGPGASCELVVGVASLLVRFPAIASAHETARAAASLARVHQTDPIDQIHQIDRIDLPDGGASTGREHRFEVAYGGDGGPDLAEVARLTGLSAREVVARHGSALYTVAFVGFSPGFGYLLGLPAELRLPRLSSPRPRVPAGSVAIAGPFSGIYPRSTPGGWRLLGRTAVTLFDPAAEPPALLAPGDRVRFVPR